jgi:hypothetical protein
LTKGVLYKSGTAWTKSQAKKLGGSAMTDGKIMHSNGTTWFDNYPMEEYITKDFPCTWTQGWIGNGTRLDDTAWYGNIITGSTSGYRGMIGFDKNALTAHIGSGEVTEAKLLVNCYETTLNGSPDVHIGKHSYASEPAGTWTGQNADWGDYTALHVPNKATGGYWVTLKDSQLRMSNGAVIGGVALRGATNTAEDMGKFSGKNQFTSILRVTVLK